jgi:cellulose synthase/poly-beta-1,6-N-acetylglucosamine synthase-like glycosyltransferase/transposase
MPARKKHTASFRAELIRSVQEIGSVSDVCKKYRISRKTYYKWISVQNKEQTLHNRKSGRKSYIDSKIESLVIELIKANPTWSVSKLYDYLTQSNDNKQLVSRHWIQCLLEKRELSTQQKRKAYSYQFMPQLPVLEEVQTVPNFQPESNQQIVLQAGNSSPPVNRNYEKFVQLFSPAITFAKPYLQSAYSSISSKLNKTQASYLESFTQKIINNPGYSLITIFVAFANAFLASKIIQVVIEAEGIIQKVGITLSTLALICGIFFFVYSLKYYFTILMVVLKSKTNKSNTSNISSYLQSQSKPLQVFNKAVNSLQQTFNQLGDDNSNPVALHEKVTSHSLEEFPFFSVQIPLYNEKRVADRVVSAAVRMDYPNFEVIVCDDSTDETTQILQEKWGNHPKVKILHRENRSGFKGAALNNALQFMDKRTDYVVIFDADFVPYPDTLNLFAKYFAVIGKNEFSNIINPAEAFANAVAKPYQNTSSYAAESYRGKTVAVQGYQWHVLNKSENWITRAVRSEFAGSYIIERSGAQLFSLLKQIAGSVYAINASVLKNVGWGTSITEDFQLTLNLYEKGFKVAYTPYIQAPSECVSTLKRLIRQRQRWAEGHSYNIKKHLHQLLTSSDMTQKEKWETLYLTPYYLQSLIFIVGTVCWIIAETVLKVKLPFWTSALGWSLVLTNLFSLPLMNTIGLFLEEGEERDYLGIFSFITLCYLLAPFIGWAALKGFMEEKEGPWFRTPKSGRITDKVQRGAEKKSERLARLIPWLRPAIGIFNKVSASQTSTSPYLAYATAGNNFNKFSIGSRSRGFKKRISNFAIILLLGVTTFTNLLQATVPQAFANPDTYYFRATQDNLAADNLTTTTNDLRVAGNNTIGANTQVQTMSAANPTFYMLTDNLNKVWTNDTEINDSNTTGERRSVSIATHTDGSTVAVWEDSRNTDSTQNIHTATTTTTAATARKYATATNLIDGRVLVVGGNSSTDSTMSSAEIYDPLTNTFAALTNNMIVRRANSSIITLNDGRALVAGGQTDYGSALTTTEIFDPNTNTFVAGTGMPTARNNFTMVKLNSGKVAAIGGATNSFIGAGVSSIDLFDPSTNTWTAAAGGLNTARADANAVLLNNGEVLIVGGYDGSTYHSVAEIFNPVTNTTRRVSGLITPRRAPFMGKLLDGKVVVGGGFTTGGAGSSSSEIYDPVADSWSSLGNMAAGPDNLYNISNGYSAILLGNGKLYVPPSSGLSTTAQLFEPLTNTWTSTASGLNDGHTNGIVVPLYNGKVLTVGGLTSANSPSNTGTVYTPVTYDIYAQKYDSAGAKLWNSGTDIKVNTDDGNRVSSSGPPNYNHLNPSVSLDTSGNAIVAWEEQRDSAFRSSIWSQKLNSSDGAKQWPSGTQNQFSRVPASTVYSRTAVNKEGATVTSLKNGKVLIAGTAANNNGRSTAEIYDPVARSFTSGPKMVQNRYAHSATPLLDGRVLLAGSGVTAADASSAEIYNPESNTFAATTNFVVGGRSRHAGVLLKNGKVLIVGGVDGVGATTITTSSLYDPTSGTFSAGPNFSYPHIDGNAITMPNGKVLVVGDSNSSAGSTAAELFDPQLNTVSKVPGAHAAKYWNGLVLLNSGKVLSVGAASSGASTAELYDPALNTWTSAGTMLKAIQNVNLTVLPNGKVLQSGGWDLGPNASTSVSELYDPSTNTWTATANNLSVSRVYPSQSYVPQLNKMFIVKGDDNASNSTAELYTPVADMPVSQFDYKQNEGYVRTNNGDIDGVFFKKPKVAIDANGDAVIVWQDNKNSIKAFQGRSYNFATNNYQQFGQPVSISGGMASSDAGSAIPAIAAPPISILGQKICNQATCADTGTTSGERQWGNTLNTINKNSPEDIYLSSVPSGINVGLVNDGTNMTIVYQSNAGSVGQNSKTDKIYAQKIDTDGQSVWNGLWTNSTSNLTNVRYKSNASLLGDGTILVTGGQDAAGATLSSAEVYNPSTQTSTVVGNNMTTNRIGHRTTLLTNGQVLITGGGSSQITGSSSANLYNPATNTFIATTGNMIGLRNKHTATLLSNGRVLLAGGLGISTTYLSSAETFNPATGTFTAITGNINAARAYHSAAALNDGRVLMAGGASTHATVAVVTANIYNPTVGTSAAATSMAIARSNFTLTALSNGKVLAVGGYNNSSVYLSSAEVYDPGANTWSTTTGSLNSGARAYHTSSLLPNGQVLILGGTNGTVNYSAAELYNPATGTFTVISSTNTARAYASTVVLPNGKIVTLGGSSATDAETTTAATAPSVNNAATNWTTPGNMYASDNAYGIYNNTARNVLSLSTFGFSIPSNANILGFRANVEGNGASATAAQRRFEISLTKNASAIAGTAKTANQLNQTTDTTLTIPSTGSTRDQWGNNTFTPSEVNAAGFGFRIRDNDATAAALNFDNVTAQVTYITNSSQLSSAEIYSIDQPVSVNDSSASQKPDIVKDSEGNFQIVWQAWQSEGLYAGNSGGAWKVVGQKLNNPATGSTTKLWPSGTVNEFTTATSMPGGARTAGGIAVLPNGKILLAGGTNGTTYSTSLLYDPSADTWTSTGNLNTPREAGYLTVLPNGKALIIGGNNGGTYLSTAELYDPDTGTWTATGNNMRNGVRSGPAVVQLNNGKVLVAGGNSTAGLTGITTSELYDPSTNTWTATTGNLRGGARAVPSYSALPNGQVLIASGFTGAAILTTSEIYNPDTDTWTLTTGSLRNGGRIVGSTISLNTGKILFAGGTADLTNPVSTAEIFDPSTQTWTTTSSLVTRRLSSGISALPSGKILMTGGGGFSSYLSSSEIYDPITATWTAGPFLPSNRAPVTQNLNLKDGRIFFPGGQSGAATSTAISTAVLYNPELSEMNISSDDSNRRFNQLEPKIASDSANGSTYVTWEDERYTSPSDTTIDKNIYMQKVGSTGVPLWPNGDNTNGSYNVRDVRVDTTRGSLNTTVQVKPVIGKRTFTTGTTVPVQLAWNDSRDGSPPISIYGQSYDTLGRTMTSTSWTAYFVLNNLASGDTMDVLVGATEADGESLAFKSTTGTFDGGVDATNGEKSIVFSNLPPSGETNLTHKRLFMKITRTGGTYDVRYNGANDASGTIDADTRLDVGIVVPERTALLGFLIPILPILVFKRRNKNRVSLKLVNERSKK